MDLARAIRLPLKSVELQLIPLPPGRPRILVPFGEEVDDEPAIRVIGAELPAVVAFVGFNLHRSSFYYRGEAVSSGIFAKPVEINRIDYGHSTFS
jgi:hypothetical protein